MSDHPLTDKICDQITDELDKIERFFGVEDCMRSAADWQLERDAEELNQMLYVFEIAGKIDEADRVGLLKVFKEAMRPQENNNV